MKALAFFVAGMALAVAGCSSDSGSSTAPTSGVETTAAVSDTTAAAPDTTAAPADTTDSSGGDQYPDEVRTNFLDSCNQSSGGNTEACTCALESIEAKFSLEEFVALEQSMNNGTDVPAEITAAIQGCF